MGYILVVDDDKLVLGSIQEILEDDGFEVRATVSALEALDWISNSQPDLCLLDIIMPEMSGIDLCRRIRSNPFTAKVPIIFLTAKGRPTDVASGLDAGADDYMVKPFEVLELPARIRALLRRVPGGKLDPESNVIKIANVELNNYSPNVIVRDETIELTSIEHRLLYTLMINAGQPVSVETLLETVWEYPKGVGDPNLVRVHVANLRSKIQFAPDLPQYIRNVRGKGYLFTP